MLLLFGCCWPVGRTSTRYDVYLFIPSECCTGSDTFCLFSIMNIYEQQKRQMSWRMTMNACKLFSPEFRAPGKIRPSLVTTFQINFEQLTVMWLAASSGLGRRGGCWGITTLCGGCCCCCCCCGGGCCGGTVVLFPPTVIMVGMFLFCLGGSDFLGNRSDFV